MTNTFKKIVALLLGIVLTVSLCSVAFATGIASVDAATLASLGVSGGNSTQVVDSPDGSGEKVILYDATGVRPNVELASTWVEGTVYTVAFKYWMAQEHTGGSFQFYYGEAPAKSGKTPSTSFSVDNSHIGDGQWHTVHVKFTYNVPTSNAANTKVYLTFYAGGRFKIYLKDIKVKAESTANCYGDFDILKTDDGTAIKNHTSYTNGSNGMLNKSTVAADGAVVFAPSSNGNCSNLTDTFKGSIQYVKVRNVASSGNYKVTLMPGNDYSVTIKYKAVALNSAGKGGFGIGYLGSATAGYTEGGWSEAQLVDSLILTSTSDHYSTYCHTFTYEGATDADLVIAIPYTGQQLAILETIVARKTTGAELYSFVTYNDNGEYTSLAEFVGEPLALNGSNGYLGEECKGWSTSPLLTGDNVTTVPAEDTVLYAKYDTVVIDKFNFENGMRSGYDNYNANTASIVQSSNIKFSTTTVGFMIPAYDYKGDNDGVAGNYEWYTFQKGQKYNVALEVSNVTTGNVGNYIAVTAATGAGSGGKRSTSNQAYLYIVDANTSGADMQFGAAFTCNFADGYNYAVIRGTSENANMSLNIEKIIITKVSDEPVAKLTAVSKRDASEKITAGVRFKGRVSGHVINGADEAGFVVVPTAALGGKTVAEYIAEGGVVTKCVNYDKASGSNIVYDGFLNNYPGTVAAYYDYQVVLTGLTSLTDDTLDLRGVEFTIAFYTAKNNSTVYHDTYTTSYNKIAAMQ